MTATQGNNTPRETMRSHKLEDARTPIELELEWFRWLVAVNDTHTCTHKTLRWSGDTYCGGLLFVGRTGWLVSARGRACFRSVGSAIVRERVHGL